ncbi:MAG: noncanonical pyrimidine nucleotidase, YjjG family [Ruminococcaceae bacterium]|nr:noncanonical pyrimidine nucleotidase, YjjG family [Oscillospiraceae bacterium]
MIEFLFLDLDDTILDFHMQESVAIRKTLSGAGIEPTDENCNLYSKINLRHWKMLELGEITREKLIWHRFAELFETLGVTADPKATAERYMDHLSEGHYFLPGAEEAVKALAKKYKLYLASNGAGRVQESRIASAKLAPLFKDIFISEEMGANKPDKAYFDACFARINDFNPQRAMIVGDSLSSDIRGGKNAGIYTCWVNPKGKTAPPESKPDFEIKSVTELEEILKTV